MPIFVRFLGKVVVMAKKRVLFISQEIVPYLPESEMANIGRFLPQGIQDKGKEIRTFMPRYGCINERRNQPVSYTHLDVYKRQGITRDWRFPWKLRYNGANS